MICQDLFEASVTKGLGPEPARIRLTPNSLILYIQPNPKRFLINKRAMGCNLVFADPSPKGGKTWEKEDG
jgi:hypothetical protein